MIMSGTHLFANMPKSMLTRMDFTWETSAACARRALQTDAEVTTVDVHTTTPVHLVVFVILIMEVLAFANRVLVALTASNAVCQKKALKDALKLALKAAVAVEVEVAPVEMAT